MVAASLVVLLIGQVLATDLSCQLQRKPADGALMVGEMVAGPEMAQATSRSSSPSSNPWFQPGLHFEHCPVGSKVKKMKMIHTELVQVLEPLPNKVNCPFGSMPIGQFQGGIYNFSCCSSGPQCGGCRTISGGSCVECAAGYTRQEIPVLNTSKCFLCDDLPKWQDALGRSCYDYSAKKLCQDGKVNKTLDVPFQGVSPSQACCACGGGSVYPTPTFIPFASASLHSGQVVQSQPQPPGLGVLVKKDCQLLGLNLSDDGSVQGKIPTNASESVKCSFVLSQDPVRGISSSVQLSVPVSDISYGEQVLIFKYWGLDRTQGQQFDIQTAGDGATTTWDNFQLTCVPSCPWLQMTDKGTLTASFPSQLVSGVEGYGADACSCQVKATPKQTSGANKPASTSFTAVQRRFWVAASFGLTKNELRARVGQPIPQVPMLEFLGSGLQPVVDTSPEASVEVVKNVSSGQDFLVLPSLKPQILDVTCHDDYSTDYAWSRITGDLKRKGQDAFNLNPMDGSLSGTPQLDLSRKGQGSLDINCSIALGGQLYDKELPLLNFRVKLLADVCFVPDSVPAPSRWSKLDENQTSCYAECRKQSDCAAVYQHEQTCLLLSASNTSKETEDKLENVSAMIRLDNCSEDESSLELVVPQAGYVHGKFQPSNVYKSDVSYARSGDTIERQLVFARKEDSFSKLPSDCANASWLLLHTNLSDFINGSAGPPEFWGSAMACAQDDVVKTAFKEGSADFKLNFLPSELKGPGIFEKPAAVQNATVKLSVPSCAAPNLEGFEYGTVQDPEFYSLKPCECFGSAYASHSPVTSESNEAVPRNKNPNDFNNDTLPPVQIFKGPYRCEEDARLDILQDTALPECSSACLARSDCRFYMFTATDHACTLYESCDYMQQVNVKISNELYGLPPGNTSFCRIADPEACWQDVRRRSYLSLTESDLPVCLFQEQHVGCDSLQLVSGELAGFCARCQYLDARSSYALKGMRKIPLPEEFPAASQIVVGCNETSRMFAQLQDGLVWNGPKPKTTFSCVSGKWVGDPVDGGAWQSLENLRCEECLQLGSSNLQRLANVSMPEVFFMEHRLIQMTHGFKSGSGSCGFDTCLYGMDMVDTAHQLWNLSVADPKGDELQLLLLHSDGAAGRFNIELADNPGLCLAGNFSAMVRPGHYPVQVSTECDAPWVLNEESSSFTRRSIFQYYGADNVAYYLVSGGNDAWTIPSLVRSSHLPNTAETLPFWHLEHLNDSNYSDALSISTQWGKSEAVLSAPTAHIDIFQSGNFKHHNCSYSDSDCSNTSVQSLILSICTEMVPGSSNNILQATSVTTGNFVNLDPPLEFSWSGIGTTRAFFSTVESFGVQLHLVCGDGKALSLVRYRQHYPYQEGPGFMYECTPFFSALKPKFMKFPYRSRMISIVNGTSLTTQMWPFECPPEAKSLGFYFLASIDFDSESSGEDQTVTCLGFGIGESGEIGNVALAAQLWPSVASQSWRLVKPQASSKPKLNLHPLRTCDVTVEIDNIPLDLPAMVKPQRMELDVLNFDALSTEQQAAYNSTAAALIFASDFSTSVFFACQVNVLQHGASTSCAHEVSMLEKDVANFTGTVDFYFDEDERSLKLTPTSVSVCPVLTKTSKDAPPGITFQKGWKMSDAFHFLWKQNYAAAPFLSPSEPPFNYTGTNISFARLVGFLGLSANGNSLWGLACPLGAVVFSDERSLPHCLQINATGELDLTSYSGSLSCPGGMALGGWYNLPGVPVRKIDDSSYGGPTRYTGLHVSCRKTPYLTSCTQPEKPACQTGHVINAISFNANQFKVGCCQLQSLLGAKFTPQSRTQVPYDSFEGYYCPVVKDNTGAIVYSKTSIKELGEPGNASHASDANWTLSWNRFEVSWELHKHDKLYTSAEGDAVFPVEVHDPKSNFSATWIRPLKASWLRSPKVESLFPKKKPTYPQLKKFAPEKPNYKEYCSPEYLQQPRLFKGSISDSNPCYHTFNVELIKGGHSKGISERGFWSCADRSKARQYMRDVAVASIEEQKAKMEKMKRTEEEVVSAVELAGALIGMFPWGSYGGADQAGAKETQVVIENSVRKEAEVAGEKAERRALQEFSTKVKARFAKEEKQTIKIETSESKDRFQEINKEALEAGQHAWENAGDVAEAVGNEVMAGEETYNGKSEAKGSPMASDLVPSYGKGDETHDQNSEFHKELAKAEWDDCMPLQAGLSKVMCDLFCVQDSVRAGTTAVLQSLDDSHQILMDNLQALLNYQTQYILWAMTQLPAANITLMQESIPSVSDILTELTQVNFETGVPLSMDLVNWHRAAGQDLYQRLASMSVNASAQNWPFRVHAMNNMVRHFGATFQQKLQRPASPQEQLHSKLRAVREEAEVRRLRAGHAQALDLRGHDAATKPLMESLLHCQEKHTTFTLFHLKALDEVKEAVNLAQNFSECGTDTQNLQNAWQRAMRSEERAKEALLEAWSATVTSADHINLVLDEDMFLHLAEQNFDLMELDDEDAALEEMCQNMTSLAQQLYSKAFKLLEQEVKPLVEKVATFRVLAAYQEKELKKKQLKYVPLPDLSKVVSGKLLEFEKVGKHQPGEFLGLCEYRSAFW